MDKIHLATVSPCKMPTKANEVSTPGNNGALRYALHLRFLSPTIKKKGASRSVQRSKSDCSSALVLQEMEERRYYLYNDLRVVFPQRHSDSDEGKVCQHINIFFFFNVLPWYHVMTRCSSIRYTLLLCNNNNNNKAFNTK
jgi:Flp pilus assembly protein TadB